MAAASRTARETETREAERRPSDNYRPASLLPVPAPQPGYTFRWIRTSWFGQADAKNVSSRMREGWVPVKAEDHPEIDLITDKDSHFPDGIEVGGLLLCKIASEQVAARKRYYAARASDQIVSVDNMYLRENDPRMPLSRPERRTRISFGSREGSDE